MQYTSVYLIGIISFKKFNQDLLHRIETLENEKLLNFIPPTGSFVLINYNISEASLAFPFEVIHSLTFDEQQVKILLKIESRPVRGTFYVVDEFHLKLLLPQ